MSVAADIEAAIVTVLAGVDATPVRVRKEAALLDGDPDVVVVVTVKRVTATPLDTETDHAVYRSTIARAERHKGKAADQAAGLTWLEAARKKLHTPTLAGVPVVFHAVIEDGEPFAPPPLTTGLNLTSLAVQHWTVEPRG